MIEYMKCDCVDLIVYLSIFRGLKGKQHSDTIQ